MFLPLLFLRVVISGLPKKYMVWLWRLYFLRIVCPIQISSTFSIVPPWNRSYHRFLADVGLDIDAQHGGLLRSLRDVWQANIQVTSLYRIMAIGYFAGMLLLVVLLVIRAGKVRSAIRMREKRLEGTLYQSAVELPVMTGLFVNRVFLPETMNVQEAKYTLAHMECRRARRSNLWNAFYVAALLLHWYDPCVWAAVFLVRRDEQMACDECAVDGCSAADKNAYIQGILNIVPQESRVPFTACASFETDLERRSQRLLHQGSDRMRYKMTGVILLLLMFFWLFLLRPVQNVWAGGTWNAGSEKLSANKDTRKTNLIISQTDVLSPSGLKQTVSLRHKRNEANGRILANSYELQLADAAGSELAVVDLQKVFREQGIAKDTLEPLIGIPATWEDYEKIKHFVEKYAGIEGSHDLVIHNYGPGRSMAIIHAEVPNDVPIDVSHEIIDRIEREAMEQLGISLTIHMDPVETRNEEVLQAKHETEKAVEALDPRCSIHDFRMVNGEKQINLIFDFVIPREYSEEKGNELTLTLMDRLQHHNPKYQCVITLDRSYVEEQR